MNPGFVEAGGKEAARCPLMASNDALKRSTDCIYFLASLLTCKKGRGCEYRHSEGARANPIDCRYWLNGNCLKLRCSFRHPKLVGIPAAPLPKTIRKTPYVGNRDSVPCIYFQKGRCWKGNKCPFMHWTAATEIPVSATQTRKQLETAPLAANHVAKLPEIHYPWENVPGQLGRELLLAESWPGFDVIVDQVPIEVAAHSGRHQYPTTDVDFERDGLDRRCMPKRRALHREEESDLHHQLLKRRRTNGSRSASTEERDDPTSSRLQGRITLPAARSSPVARLPGRERGIIRHRITFPPPHEARSKSSRARPDTDPSNFAAPKCFAELKASKVSEKSIGVGETFEDPMPLTDILKKREEDKVSSSSEAGGSGLEDPFRSPATNEVQVEDSMMVDEGYNVGAEDDDEFDDEEDDFVKKVDMLYGH